MSEISIAVSPLKKTGLNVKASNAIVSPRRQSKVNLIHNQERQSQCGNEPQLRNAFTLSKLTLLQIRDTDL